MVETRRPLTPPVRGRGAVTNVPGRFERFEITPFDDGWGSLDEPASPLETIVTEEAARSILSTNDSPDIPFRQSINPYKGCEHGCVYCYARPTHSFLGLSPGLDFESRIFAKTNAADLLRKQLARKAYRCEPIALGANTDPYQPVERRLRITRSILEVLAEYRHPVIIVTKSNMVLRDLDLLTPMAQDGLAAVYLSVTTLDRSLARCMEPRAPTPDRRLEALESLCASGVPVGVMASPMIPGINDTELESILEAAAKVGVRRATYILLRLPHELKQIFNDWLETHFPTRARKVRSRIRDMRGGRLNDSSFGNRMRGSGRYAELLQRRFELACRRLDMNRDRIPLDVSRFRSPVSAGGQGNLFA